ncbi:HD-GYP domain-containing protein [Desulfosporosinus fructosivorans]
MRLGNISIVASKQIQKYCFESMDSVTDGNDKALSINQFLQALAMTLAVRNKDTWEHSVQVTKYAVRLGLRLELSGEEIKQLHIGALLHDIGKIGIRDDILLKPCALTEDEYCQLKKHPEIGSKILEPASALDCIIPIVLHHHEHFDGKGYPQKLRGKKIPFLARIISLADAFEAMTSDRLYRKAMTPQHALEEIQLQLGKQFDPDLGKAFVKMIEEVYFIL